MTRFLTVIPAYGRDYTRADAMLADWNAGKDMLIATIGRMVPINKSQSFGLTIVGRYKRLTKICKLPSVKKE
jgi:hypothetical protein